MRVYSDNETDVDLLGFEDQVHNLLDLVTDPSVLPVTAGVLADWGAGKSSLLKMAAIELRQRDVVVIEFSPWRIETYDDAKTAFLSAVVEQVAGHLPDEPETPLARRAVAHLAMLRRRVRWMRVTGLAAKHIVTLSAPSLDDLDGLLRDKEEPDSQPNTESVSRDFRQEFEELVAGLEDKSVVVLIDDLDRSLPDQVLEILQAIRLFLSVRRTAFVIATDERVVRDAIRLRYPQAALSSETDLASEYLEKIVQVPIRIPPVGPAEAESYLNLLVAQAHLPPDEMAACIAKAKEVRASGSVSVSMNLGLARDALGGDLGIDAEREFALMGRVSRLLAVGLKGNPRQLKRYLNGLEMRWNTAVRRGLDLDRGVLAKLMVLEYAEPVRYRDLHRWVSAGTEIGDALRLLEPKARRMLGIVETTPALNSNESGDSDNAETPATAPTKRAAANPPGSTARRTSDDAMPEQEAQESGGRTSGRTSARRGSDPKTTQLPEPHIPADAQRWLEAEWQMEWLALDPPLANVDLGPYFELGREALPSVAVRARALPERLQQLLQRMASSTSDVRDQAAGQAAALAVGEASSLTDAALDRLASEKTPGNLMQALATVAATHTSLAPSVFRAIHNVPFDGLTAGLPIAMARKLGQAAQSNAFDEVLRLWANQTANKRLGTSARQTLDDRA